MALGSVAAFWAVSFMLVLVPGADWAYAIASGLRDRSVLPAVSGLLAGYLALTAVVAAGIAALVSRTPMVLTALTAVGGAYLIWLGATTLARPAAVPAAGEAPADPVPWPRRALKGAGISGLNPKALLLTSATTCRVFPWGTPAPPRSPTRARGPGTNWTSWFWHPVRAPARRIARSP